MFEHLDESVIPIIGQSMEQKLEWVRSDFWVGYTRADEILGYLDDLMHYPKSIRMPCALLVGEPGNGKSTIVEEFSSRHEVTFKETGEPIMPVLVMDMPSRPKDSEFYSQILFALKVAHKTSDGVESKKDQAHRMLLALQTRIVILDEFHDILHCTSREQRAFLSVLKKLTNLLKIPVVGVGTREAITVFHTDTQLSSRFEAIGLSKWKLDKEFIKLLISFERLLPLAEPSYLNSREIATKLFSMSEGTIGGLNRVLVMATTQALREGKEKITLETLNNINYVKLKDYGLQANK